MTNHQPPTTIHYLLARLLRWLSHVWERRRRRREWTFCTSDRATQGYRPRLMVDYQKPTKPEVKND